MVRADAPHSPLGTWTEIVEDLSRVVRQTTGGPCRPVPHSVSEQTDQTMARVDSRIQSWKSSMSRDEAKRR